MYIEVRDLSLRDIVYVVPGCAEDGAGMLWENSSAAVVAAAVLAHPHMGWGRLEGGV